MWGRSRSCAWAASESQDGPWVKRAVLAVRRDRGAEDVERHDEVLPRLVVLLDLARGDVVGDLHADEAAGAERAGLLGGPRDRVLARLVDALGEVRQLLVGLQ